MVCDFLCGSVGVSVVGYIILACFTLSQKGGYGLEGIVLAVALGGLVVMNGAMAVAVYVGASKKRKALACPVTARPRWRMVVAGLAAPLVGIPVAWCAAAVASQLPGLGIPAFFAAAAAPAGLAAWWLARPCDEESL